MLLIARETQARYSPCLVPTDRASAHKILPAYILRTPQAEESWALIVVTAVEADSSYFKALGWSCYESWPVRGGWKDDRG